MNKKHVFKSVTVLVLSLLIGVSASAEESGKTLSLDMCIDLALANHPSMISAQADVRAADSRIRQQEAGLMPTVSASARHTSRRGSDATSSGVSLNQLITDGGKTSVAIKAARLNHEAALSDLKRSRQLVIHDVTSAYFGFLQFRWDVIVGEETLALYEDQLKKAQAAYEAGTVAKSDVTAAEVDLGNARLGLVRTRADLERARALLENAMGTPDLPEQYSLEEPQDPTGIEITLQTAIEEAIRNRPDYASDLLGVKAAEAGLSLQAKAMSPELSAYAGYDWSHSGAGNDDDWNAGLSLSIPLYDGGLARARTEEARAALEKSRSGLETSRQSILLEIKTALLDLEEARENIRVSSLVVGQAKENLDLATGRYRVGVGNSLEVSQAAENYSRARKDHNQAIYKYHLSRAALEKSMGRDLLPWLTNEAGGSGSVKKGGF